MSKCAQQIASIMSIARDFGIELETVAHSDATAALGIAYRRGLGGTTRHVKAQYLWIQDAIKNKEFQVNKVGTHENPAADWGAHQPGHFLATKGWSEDHHGWLRMASNWRG